MKIPYEKIIYSDFNLPIRAKLMNSDEGDIWADAHIHEEIEIVYLAKGSLFFSFVDGTVEVKAGEIIFINPMVPHYTYEKEGQFTEICVLQFHPKLLMHNKSNFLFSYPFAVLNHTENSFHTLKIKGDKNLESICESIYNINSEIIKRNTAYELSIMTYIYQILTRLFRYGGMDFSLTETLDPDNDEAEKLKPVFSFIESHYSEKITLEQVASLINYSTQYFCCIFKKETGKSFVEYLNYFRTKEAEQLLINTKDTINDIYIRTGFSSFSYFNRVFKKYNGYSPSEYRKILCNQHKPHDKKTEDSDT